MQEHYCIGLYTSSFTNRAGLVNTLDAQLERMYRYMGIFEGHGEVVAIYRDEAFNDKSMNRAELQFLLADARDGSLDYVFLTGYRRLSPDADDRLAIEAELNCYGVIILTAPKSSIPKTLQPRILEWKPDAEMTSIFAVMAGEKSLDEHIEEFGAIEALDNENNNKIYVDKSYIFAKPQLDTTRLDIYIVSCHCAYHKPFVERKFNNLKHHLLDNTDDSSCTDNSETDSTE